MQTTVFNLLTFPIRLAATIGHVGTTGLRKTRIRNNAHRFPMVKYSIFNRKRKISIAGTERQFHAEALDAPHHRSRLFPLGNFLITFSSSDRMFSGRGNRQKYRQQTEAIVPQKNKIANWFSII